jgi:hypothetical protein
MSMSVYFLSVSSHICNGKPRRYCEIYSLLLRVWMTDVTVKRDA